MGTLQYLYAGFMITFTHLQPVSTCNLSVVVPLYLGFWLIVFIQDDESVFYSLFHRTRTQVYFCNWHLINRSWLYSVWLIMATLLRNLSVPKVIEVCSVLNILFSIKRVPKARS